MHVNVLLLSIWMESKTVKNAGSNCHPPYVAYSPYTIRSNSIQPSWFSWLLLFNALCRVQDCSSDWCAFSAQVRGFSRQFSRLIVFSRHVAFFTIAFVCYCEVGMLEALLRSFASLRSPISFHCVRMRGNTKQRTRSRNCIAKIFLFAGIFIDFII